MRGITKDNKLERGLIMVCIKKSKELSILVTPICVLYSISTLKKFFDD
jgi:hypothetical protein